MKPKWLVYDFDVFAPDTRWNAVPGIYIFCGINQRGLWQAGYIGQTESFSDRIPDHEQWGPAARWGATHIHALVVQQAATRDQIERALIQAYQPPLNVQLKSYLSGI